jgi:hypothetical protein
MELFSGPHLVVLIFLIFSTVIYLIPTMIAIKRKKRDRINIIWFNVIIGWTIIGWIITLVWALSKDKTIDSTIVNQIYIHHQTIN